MTSLPNDESDGGIPAYDSDRFDLTQDEFDREFFTQVLRHGDSNLDVVRRLAELLARHGDYGGSLRLDQQLCERCPDEPLVFYNLACSLSMHGDHREAIDALARAVELGYRDFAHIDADTDLDPLRDFAGFQELLRRAAGGEDYPPRI